jgi:beta-phosphoglucomutase-like phosphatase (HAD superfamily)
VAELIPGAPFDVVVAGDNVINSKPDPEAYLLAAERLNVDVRDCVAFEDSPAGCRAAFGSGAITVGVPHLVSLENVNASRVVDSLVGWDASTVSRLYSTVSAERVS